MFKNTNILNTIKLFFILSAFYAFDAEYPKETTGHSKNVFLFLKHILICKHGRSLTNGSIKLFNYPICELLYFLTYYFLIKLFGVFAELM